jgi:hypothetical protein
MEYQMMKSERQIDGRGCYYNKMNGKRNIVSLNQHHDQIER